MQEPISVPEDVAPFVRLTEPRIPETWPVFNLQSASKKDGNRVLDGRSQPFNQTDDKGCPSRI
ncbi:hypothetical protein KKI24_13885 [bacterium]|nr:hypothetical protein [bacterium]